VPDLPCPYSIPYNAACCYAALTPRLTTQTP
jgi:hypothetical protein